jgi:hypothetical protein
VKRLPLKHLESYTSGHACGEDGESLDVIERRSKGELESSHLLAADLFDLGNNHGETTTGG